MMNHLFVSLWYIHPLFVLMKDHDLNSNLQFIVGFHLEQIIRHVVEEVEQDGGLKVLQGGASDLGHKHAIA